MASQALRSTQANPAPSRMADCFRALTRAGLTQERTQQAEAVGRLSLSLPFSLSLTCSLACSLPPSPAHPAPAVEDYRCLFVVSDAALTTHKVL